VDSDCGVFNETRKRVCLSDSAQVNTTTVEVEDNKCEAMQLPMGRLITSEERVMNNSGIPCLGECKNYIFVSSICIS